MGWDYLVEFPYPDPDPQVPLDKRSHPIECKVQVKTVWADTRQVELKLSAAERLARTAKPSFIVVLSVAPSLEVVAVHGFHMLDRHLEHVLKRLRKATTEGSLKINRTHITFNLSDGARLPATGEALRRFIADACGNDLNAYHQKKQHQLESLGFGTLRFEGRLSIKAQDEAEVAQVFLGLREGELVNFEAKEIRFGIALPAHSASGGILKVTPRPVDECRIVARGLSGSPFVTLSARLYLPPRRGEDGEMPFRLSTAFFEIFVNGSQFNIENRRAELFDAPVTAKDLLAALTFYKIIASGGGRLTVLARGKEIVGSEFDVVPDAELLDWTTKQITFVEMIAAVFKAAGALSQPIIFSKLAEHWRDIQFLGELIEGGKDVRVNSMTFRPEVEIELPPISEALLLRRLRLSDFALAYYAVMDVTLTEQPPEVALDVGGVTLRDIAIIGADDAAFRTYCEEARLTTGVAMSLVTESA